jgi:hypothetical protein
MPNRMNVPRETGQALVETLLVGMVFSLAIGLILVWAKLQSIDQGAVSVARASAFECASSRHVCESDSTRQALSRAILGRTIGGTDRQVLSGDALAEGAPEAVIRPFWRGLDGRAMVQEPGGLTVYRQAMQFDAGLAVAERASGRGDAAGALLSEVGPVRFGLDPRAGLHLSGLSFKVSALWPGRSSAGLGRDLEFGFHGRAALLSDAWNASAVTGDPADSVESRVMHARRLEPAIEAAISIGHQLTRTHLKVLSRVGLEPLGNAFSPGSIDVSIVPADRVQP